MIDSNHRVNSAMAPISLCHGMRRYTPDRCIPSKAVRCSMHCQALQSICDNDPFIRAMMRRTCALYRAG